jgi:hypothetical protein
MEVVFLAGITFHKANGKGNFEVMKISLTYVEKQGLQKYVIVHIKEITEKG